MSPKVNWHDDRQWSSSRLKKNWDSEKKWFAVGPAPKVMEWEMEVRSEHNGYASDRLGEIILKGSMDGMLTIRIREEPR